MKHQVCCFHCFLLFILSVWTGGNNGFLLTLWSKSFDELQNRIKKAAKILMVKNNFFQQISL